MGAGPRPPFFPFFFSCPPLPPPWPWAQEPLPPPRRIPAQGRCVLGATPTGRRGVRCRRRRPRSTSPVARGGERGLASVPSRSASSVESSAQPHGCMRRSCAYEGRKREDQTKTKSPPPGPFASVRRSTREAKERRKETGSGVLSAVNAVSIKSRKPRRRKARSLDPPRFRMVGQMPLE